MTIIDIVLIVAVLGIGSFLVGGTILVGFRERDEVNPLERRLAEYGDATELPQSLEEIEMGLSQKERILIPLFESLASFMLQFTPEQQVELVKLKLIQANKDTSPATFFAQRMVLTIALAGIGFMVGFVLSDWPILQAVGVTMLLAFIGYYLPMSSVNTAIKKRQNSIVRSLPDALDLLVICVEAGLGFDTAMGKVYEKWDDDLALAFGRVLQEISLGRQRSQALRDMAKRIDTPDLTSFAAAIIQAEQLGVSIGRVLRVQADQMRVKRRQRAQEKAQQAPVKMVFPLVFLIFPAIWVVLMGPAFLLMIDQGFI